MNEQTLTDYSVDVDNLLKTTFPSKEEYVPPNTKYLGEVLDQQRDILEIDVSDPNSSLDNRDAVRLLLLFRGVKGELFERLVEPYDNGFYKKSDGKSSPFGFLKLSRVQRLLGFRKDVVSVRHDLDYYRGNPKRENADEDYLKSQLVLGSRKWLAKIEYWVLRAFGWIAWKRHEKKRHSMPEYGTEQYVSQLPDC